MRDDINGWQILAKHLANHSAPESVINKVFGEEFDLELLSGGAHLLGIDHARQLAQELKLSSRQQAEFYNQVIVSRCGAKCDYHLEEFKNSFCELSQKNMEDIPCAEIDILWHFQPLHETLHAFMKRVSIASFQAECPPGCCALRVTNCRMTTQLDIPRGSLIIVSGIKPATPDELSLFQCRNRRLILGKSEEFDHKRIKWTAPIVQMHLNALK